MGLLWFAGRSASDLQPVSSVSGLSTARLHRLGFQLLFSSETFSRLRFISSWGVNPKSVEKVSLVLDFSGFTSETDQLFYQKLPEPER